MTLNATRLIRLSGLSQFLISGLIQGMKEPVLVHPNYLFSLPRLLRRRDRVPG